MITLLYCLVTCFWAREQQVFLSHLILHTLKNNKMRQGEWKQRVEAGKLWIIQWYWLKNMATNYHHFVSWGKNNLCFTSQDRDTHTEFGLEPCAGFQFRTVSLMLPLFTIPLPAPPDLTVSVHRLCLRSGAVTSVSASHQQRTVPFSSPLALLLTWPLFWN